MDVQPVFPEDMPEYGWLELRKFTNEKLLQRLLIDKHRIPKKHYSSALKQAQQIRQCLIQAEQYAAAAKSVSDSIRPLLLYYGILSLSLSEILLKGDGLSSLDKARGKHAHHGLELSIHQDPSLETDASVAASQIVAKPHILSKGERAGTFELWHRTAFEQPLCGQTLIVRGPTQQQNNYQRIADQSTTPLEKIPAQGLSLLWCFQNTPALRQALATYNIPSLHVRATMSREINLVEKFQQDTIITHPNLKTIVDRCISKIKIPNRDFENYDIQEVTDGYIIEIRASPDNALTGGGFPNAIQSETSRVFFLSDNDVLNEFGVYYVGLYLLGNYCRYYPDFWMRDFEQASSLYFLASRFMAIAENRLPVLIHSQFSNKWPITVSNSEY